MKSITARQKMLLSARQNLELKTLFFFTQKTTILKIVKKLIVKKLLNIFQARFMCQMILMLFAWKRNKTHYNKLMLV